MDKISIIIIYFLFILHSPMLLCYADLTGTFNFINNYLGYNSHGINKSKPPLRIFENNFQGKNSNLNNVGAPFMWGSFYTYTKKNLLEIKEHFKSEGTLKLTSLAYFVNRHLNEKLFIFSVINQVSENYMADIDGYFESMLKQTKTCQIEEEFYVLDFVETANKIFAIKCKNLIDDLKRQVNGSMLQKFSKTIIHETDNYMVNEKIENFNYLCEKLELCRSFPAFTDYVADLLNEILKMPDRKLLIIVKIIQENLKSKSSLFEHITHKNYSLLIGNKFNSLAENISHARGFFSIAKDVLINRFSLFQSRDGKIKKRSKCVRILIDMINKAYELVEDEYIKFQYNNIRKSIKLWASGKDKDIQTTLKNYFNSFVEIVKFYWSFEIKQEVKVLVKVMMSQKAKMDEKYNYLFTKGSSIEKVLFDNYKLPADIF